MKNIIMQRFFWIFGFLFVSTSHSQEKPIELEVKLGGSAKVVVAVSQRERAVSFLEQILNLETPLEADVLTKIIDPFYPEQEEPGEVVVFVPPPVVKPEIPKVDPMEILRQAGDRISNRIRGSLSKGGDKILSTTDGEFIRVGDQIPYSYQNETYILIVEAVTDRFFIISLENTRRSVSILDAPQ